MSLNKFFGICQESIDLIEYSKYQVNSKIPNQLVFFIQVIFFTTIFSHIFKSKSVPGFHKKFAYQEVIIKHNYEGDL